MNFVATLRIALLALRVNKMRSALTMLGIIIGVAAVICMVSIGEGAKTRIRSQIEATGTNVVLLFSGSSSSGGMRGGMGSQPTITWDDVRAIQAELPAVRKSSSAFSSARRLLVSTLTATRGAPSRTSSAASPTSCSATHSSPMTTARAATTSSQPPTRTSCRASC